MAVARDHPFLITLADGRVLLVGGLVADPNDEFSQSGTLSAEIFDPGKNRWSSTASVALDGEQLENVVAVDDGRRVLALGTESAAIYDPTAGAWSRVPSPGGVPIPLPGGTGLVFGIDYRLAASGDLEELPLTNVWDPLGGGHTVGHVGLPREPAIAVLPDGRVFIAGGVVEDTGGYLGFFLDQSTLFDPLTGVLTELATMPTARAMFSATALQDGSVLLVGGVDAWDTGWDEDEGGNDIPRCIPLKYRALRWVP